MLGDSSSQFWETYWFVQHLPIQPYFCDTVCRDNYNMLHLISFHMIHKYKHKWNNKVDTSHNTPTHQSLRGIPTTVHLLVPYFGDAARLMDWCGAPICQGSFEESWRWWKETGFVPTTCRCVPWTHPAHLCHGFLILDDFGRSFREFHISKLGFPKDWAMW